MSKNIDKPIIAVDVDDVLANEMETVRLFINERYGVDLTKDDYLVEASVYWGYWQHVWGVGEVEGTERYLAYLDAFESLEHKTVENSIKAINKLKEHFRLVVITSRHDSLINITHSWLERHFPNTFSEVAFVKVWNGDQKASKASICKALKAAYLIDDNPEHCNIAQDAGIQALLFGVYGWNKSAKLNDGIIRVRNWQEVLECFDAKS